MSRWMLEDRSDGRVDVIVDNPELGRTFVGSLYLSDADRAELAEMFGVQA